MKHEVLLETKKVLTVDTLNNSDIVGFTADYPSIKLFILWSTKQGGFTIYSNVECEGIQTNGSIDGGALHLTIKDAINSNIGRVTQVFKFDTIKELFEWLAED